MNASRISWNKYDSILNSHSAHEITLACIIQRSRMNECVLHFHPYQKRHVFYSNFFHTMRSFRRILNLTKESHSACWITIGHNVWVTNSAGRPQYMTDKTLRENRPRSQHPISPFYPKLQQLQHIKQKPVRSTGIWTINNIVHDTATFAHVERTRTLCCSWHPFK